MLEGRHKKTSLTKYIPLTLFVRFAFERMLETQRKLHILTPLLWPSRCVKIWCLCSVSSTFSNANLTNKVRGIYFSKEVFLRLPSCILIVPASSFLHLNCSCVFLPSCVLIMVSLWCWMNVYMYTTICHKTQLTSKKGKKNNYVPKKDKSPHVHDLEYLFNDISTSVGHLMPEGLNCFCLLCMFWVLRYEF